MYPAMSLITKLKSVLGFGTSRSDRTSVTVERERPGGETGGVRDRTEPTTSPVDPTPGDGADGPAVTTDRADDGSPPADGNDDPVDTIDGIGPAYAERLEAAGVGTVGELAAADPSRLAADTDISEKRVTDWVERATAAE